MRAILLSTAFLFAIGLYSCKRCQTCNVIDTADNSQVHTYGEECGKKKELESSKKACEDNYTTGPFECICTEE